MAITFNQMFTQQANGKSLHLPLVGAATSAGTAAAANSGNLSCQVVGDARSSYPSTIIPFQVPAGLPAALCTEFRMTQSSGQRHAWFGWFYNIGTANLSQTSPPVDCFTHHAATFPLLRTVFGQASQPIQLIPVMYITTATTTNAPVFILKTTAGGAGYVDQDGNNVVGTKSFTCPAAATAVQSGFILRLEDTDYAVRDITQISLTTRGNNGAATIYGFEPLLPVVSVPNLQGIDTALFSGLFGSLEPAVATSGTVQAGLGILNWENAASTLFGSAHGILE